MSKTSKRVIAAAAMFVAFLCSALLVNSASGFPWGTENAGVSVAVALVMWAALVFPVVSAID